MHVCVCVYRCEYGAKMAYCVHVCMCISMRVGCGKGVDVCVHARMCVYLHAWVRRWGERRSGQWGGACFDVNVCNSCFLRLCNLQAVRPL